MSPDILNVATFVLGMFYLAISFYVIVFAYPKLLSRAHHRHWALGAWVAALSLGGMGGAMMASDFDIALARPTFLVFGFGLGFGLLVQVRARLEG